MQLSGDELAGVADLFGALTREELTAACAELSFRAGDERAPAAFGSAVEDALASFHLVAVERDGETLLAPGPAAFPTLPAHAPDLPHMLDVETRTVDREALAEAVAERLDAAAADAVAEADAERAATLVEVTYDAEAWGPLDLAAVRERLEDVT